MLFEKLKYTLRLLQISGKTGSQNNPVEDFRKSAFAVFVVLWRQCFLYCRNKTFLCEALTQPNRWTRTWPRILMVVFLFLLTTSKCLWNWNYTQISWIWRCFKACLCWWNKTSKSYFPCDHKNAKMWAASPYQQLLRVGQFIDAFCKKKAALSHILFV